MKNYLLLFLLLLSFSFTTFAQKDCSNYLDQAKKLYSQGKFEEAISIIKACSVTETEQVKKWQLLRLLSKCYLGLGDTKMAFMTVEDMMEKNPRYQTSIIDDNTDFVSLIKKVKVVPRFSLSLSATAGINITYPEIIKSYGITNNLKNYNKGKAQQFGIYASFGVSNKLSLHAGISYVGNNYGLSYTNDNLNFEYQEKIKYLQIPVFIRYQIIPGRKFRVFVQGGVYSGFLTRASYDITKSNSNTGEKEALNNIELTSDRNKNVFGITGGVGVSYKIGEGHLFADISYLNSFGQINIPDKRFSNQTLVNNYYFIDDNLRLNNLALSFGYTFYLNYFIQRKK